MTKYDELLALYGSKLQPENVDELDPDAECMMVEWSVHQDMYLLSTGTADELVQARNIMGEDYALIGIWDLRSGEDLGARDITVLTGRNVLTTAEASVVRVGGAVYATYSEGRIISLYFMPDGSYAGHIGPIASVFSGPLDEVTANDTDGPFWSALRAALADPDTVDDDSYHLCLGWRE